MSGAMVTFPVPVTQIPSCWLEISPPRVVVLVQPLKKTIVSTNTRLRDKNQLFFIIYLLPHIY